MHCLAGSCHFDSANAQTNHVCSACQLLKMIRITQARLYETVGLSLLWKEGRQCVDDGEDFTPPMQHTCQGIS